MPDRDDTPHRGWAFDEGRNQGLQDRSQRTDQLNREANNAQFAQSGSSGRDYGQGGAQGFGQNRGFGQSGGFSQQGGGQDYVQGQNSYAPGAEIWQDGSNYNPTGYHQQQGGGFGQSSGYGQQGFGAGSGGGNYGTGGFGQQGQGSQAPDYGRQGQVGQHYSGENFGAQPRGAGPAGYGGQGGGSYGVRDYSDAARRSTYRQDQNYAGGAWTQSGYQGGSQAGSQSGGYQGQQGHEDHDPDYLTWRDNQLSSYDRDYSAWRDEQRRKHDEEYGRWRNEKKEHFGQRFHEWRSKAAHAIGLGGSHDKEGSDRTGGRASMQSGQAAPNPLQVGDNLNIVDVADGGTGGEEGKS